MKRFFCFLTHTRVHIEQTHNQKDKCNRTNGVKPFCNLCKKTNAVCKHH